MRWATFAWARVRLGPRRVRVKGVEGRERRPVSGENTRTGLRPWAGARDTIHPRHSPRGLATPVRTPASHAQGRGRKDGVTLFSI